jgi:hypothetical protein
MRVESPDHLVLTVRDVDRPPLPDGEEIARLSVIAPDFGVELHLPGEH